jgi:YVTN family beta-propeller protein
MHNSQSLAPRRGLALRVSLLAGVAALVLLLVAAREPDYRDGPRIDSENWGTVTAPVYGKLEPNAAYSAAEILAGPNKFGSYFSAVLPNGRIVKPAGVTIQIGMNPLGIALTPDGRFLIATDDDEREGGTNFTSLQNPANSGNYSLTVVDTASMQVVSTINTTDRFFVGLAITGSGPYAVWAAGGPDNDVKLYTLSTSGSISVGTPSHIPIPPILPNASGYVSNYTPSSSFNTADASGNKPPVPSGFSRTTGAQITFPAGLALSPDGKFLYVACNGDNSVAVIDTAAMSLVKQVPVGYFPYGVSVSGAGDKVLVSNWGVTEYKFKNATYSGNQLSSLAPTGANLPDGFYVPVTSTSGVNPQSSSISLLSAPKGNGALLSLQGSIYEGHPLDSLYKVGDTHPSATAIVRRGGVEVLYVTKSNSDRLGAILLNNGRRLPDVDLSPLDFEREGYHKIHGAYPNAIIVSPDSTRAYVAEAGLNSVVVIDTEDPFRPFVLGRIPTDWYPTGLALSADGRFLYVANAKGVGEDINPNTDTTKGSPPPTGLVSFSGVDSNFIYGTLQKIDLFSTHPEHHRVLAYNFALHEGMDRSVVPVGGHPSRKIKHVFFILHENKTFDSMLGNLSSHFGVFAGTSFNNRDGSPYVNGQYTGVSLNTQRLASAFATAVNYYSDSEESDAGHQFCASGISSDYTQKTLLVKSGRGLLVNKNFEPEDYPEGGYIFNNAARHGVSFKDYGAMVRIEGTDTGTSTPTTLSDPLGGFAGYPDLEPDNFTVITPIQNFGDVTSPTEGLGQSYFLALPILAVLGGKNPSGEPRLDLDYPGYNFNISDQRRAQEFINDFDRMVQSNTLPEFVYIYQPNDHTGTVQAPNAPPASQQTITPLQLIADGDVGLGMVVDHIMRSPVYYNPETGEGSAIFITYDDAQSSLDHIHPHRTPLIVVSPYAKPGFVATRHYSTASIVKTEELLLGLPPNNLGDLFATDLRDMFQRGYNGITADAISFTKQVSYSPSPEGKHIWALANHLDTSGPDRDSARLGVLIRLSLQADELHQAAAREHRLSSKAYAARQKQLYEEALKLVNGPTLRDSDG